MLDTRTDAEIVLHNEQEVRLNHDSPSQNCFRKGGGVTLKEEFEKAFEKEIGFSSGVALKMARWGAKWTANKYKKECGEGRELNYESICEIANELQCPTP